MKPAEIARQRRLARPEAALTPAEIARIPWAIPTGEGTWVCPPHGLVVFRAMPGGGIGPTIPHEHMILRGTFRLSDSRYGRHVKVVDWRAGTRSNPDRRPPPQRGDTGGFGEMTVSRCAPGGCRSRVYHPC